MNGDHADNLQQINLSRPLLSALEGLTRLGCASEFEDEILAIVDNIPLFGGTNGNGDKLVR